MIYCYYIAVSLCLIVVQTTLVPFFPLSGGLYDVPALFIVYLGLFCPVREGFPIVLVLGLVSDGLSGGPLGLYTAIYFWLFAGAAWIKTFLHMRSILLLPVVTASAILIENLLLITGMAFFVPDSKLPEAVLGTVLVEVFWGVCTGPFLVLFFRRGGRAWLDWLAKHFASDSAA